MRNGPLTHNRLLIPGVPELLEALQHLQQLSLMVRHSPHLQTPIPRPVTPSPVGPMAQMFTQQDQHILQPERLQVMSP